MTTAFDSLDLNKNLVSNLSNLGFEKMTPIQEKSLPIILQNRDVIAQAKTGSGKTVAFGLGILNSINIKQTRPQSLILCPTRELAEQVAKEIRSLARAIPNVKVLTITGGKSEYRQEKSLGHGAHIVVGTPGRVFKLLRKNKLNLEFVKFYVLDEADRMLDMGFSDDIMNISSFVPRERQTLLFSATFPPDIEEMGSVLQKDATRVNVDTSHDESFIEEEFVEVDSHKDKAKALYKLLCFYQAKRFIVFCKTKRISDCVADDLYRQGIEVSSIHGDLEQDERTEVLTMFSNRSLSGVVATDVAARGIDIKSLDLVVNYDLPNDPEVYVHRIGRTGRAGEKGRAVSLVVPREIETLKDIFEYRKNEHEIENIDIYEGDHHYSIKPEMMTLLVSGGKRDKLRPGDLVGAIVGEAKIDFKEIGDISITNIVSYVAVSIEHADFVCKKLNQGKIKNRKFKVKIL